MFVRLGSLVSRHWLATILAWVALVVLVRGLAPTWDSVTHDGDLAYLPASMPSVQGERLLERAFPERRAKSEVVLILAREDRPLDVEDVNLARRLASRYQNLLAVSEWRRWQQLSRESAELQVRGDAAGADQVALRAGEHHEIARAAWEEAIRLDESLASAYHNLSILSARSGDQESAERLRAIAWELSPQLASHPATVAGLPKDLDGAGSLPLPLIDVWTRYTQPVGDRLVSKDKQAELIVLRLSQEFMATDNIRLLGQIEEIIEEVRALPAGVPQGLVIGLSGSAAVGADMLRSAKESIQNTELYALVLVVSILVLVYRSPLLVAVPLVTIGVSLIVATGLVAALTQVHLWPGMQWWNFKIFTTTKIFVVVILFGAGTDYCLFLIARYKEELAVGYDKQVATARALCGVGDALAASALTTIVGLATMFFAQFGKFRNSGPAIGLCLLVTLIASVTLAPALLRALGSSIYWPFSLGRTRPMEPGGVATNAEQGSLFWEALAGLIIARPGLVLAACVSLMMPFAILGTNVAVTYDLVSELDPGRSSRQGAETLRRHFPIGESGPLVVLVHKAGADFDERDAKRALLDLTAELYVEGVQSVRSIASPLGNPPQRMSLTLSGITKTALQNHPLTRAIYLGKQPALKGDVARFELVLDHDPFSLEATKVLQRVDQLLQRQKRATSYWAGSHFVFAGTTAAIADLRRVTRSDNIQIQILVVLAVLAVLLAILRRPVICLYLILSVLFSYYVTIGATELYFRWVYGDTFAGLDWKVPLFLFVILVAIGQDYNIYLVTRVFEEQQAHGLFAGLKRAIVRTGGIITSCGVIMAGTFVSMTTGSLRGVVELGFALSLGVLLDTLVVRPILVPAFLALLFRRHARRQIDRSRSIRRVASAPCTTRVA